MPVRFGRGRLDSLGNRGLAAYLIATDIGLPALVDGTAADWRNSVVRRGGSNRRATGIKADAVYACVHIEQPRSSSLCRSSGALGLLVASSNTFVA